MRPAVLAVAAAVLALAGCGKPSAPSAAPAKPVRLILDYLPNAVHIGFYQADVAGYYKDEGMDVHIEAPTSTSDTLRLMAAGQAEFGVVSLLDFLNVRAKGEPLKIVMAIEQRPLAAIFSLKKQNITRPRDLVGHLVSLTGVISDEAGAKWMIKHDGGDPAAVRMINIGFNSSQQVIAGNVDAAFGFWSQDAVEVQLRQPVNVLRLYDYGVPPYPELIVFVREDFLAKDPDMVRRFLRATAHGYRDAIERPEAALVSMASKVEGDTVEGLRPYFDAVRPVLQADAPAFGYLNLPVLKAYLAWAKGTGVIDYDADPAAFATNAYLPNAGAKP